MNLKFKFALGLLGFSEADIDVIDKALPSSERLIEAEKEFGALYDKYRADIAAVSPAAKSIIAYAKKES